MKYDLEIVVRREGLFVRRPGAVNLKQLGGPEEPAGKLLQVYCHKAGLAASTVVLFVSEDLLFFKSFELPLKTPDPEEAIGYQLSMLTPFASDALLYTYKISRDKERYRVNLFAVRREPLERQLEEIAAAGYQLGGLFPEHQRYVTAEAGKKKWALVLPGRFAKVFVFAGPHLQERLLSSTGLVFEEVTEALETENLYHLEPPDQSRFLEGSRLAHREPLLKEYDLLPAAYKRPDYLKMAIAALVALNLVALVFLAGVSVYRLQALDNRLEAEIAEVMPTVKEINTLRAEEQQLLEYTKEFEGLGMNPDLIGFLQKLTETLPANSYLAQMRMDPTSGAISMQGYTDDISQLTSSLQALGEPKLKSTSRRRDQTYFDVEINLP